MNVEILSIFPVGWIVNERVIVQRFDGAISGFLGQGLEQLIQARAASNQRVGSDGAVPASIGIGAAARRAGGSVGRT